MWLDNILIIPLWGWLLLLVLVTGIIVFCLRCRRSKSDPIKEHMDYYCQCYARGEISKDDFEELKKDLDNYLRCHGKNETYSTQDLKKHNE